MDRCGIVSRYGIMDRCGIADGCGAAHDITTDLARQEQDALCFLPSSDFSACCWPYEQSAGASEPFGHGSAEAKSSAVLRIMSSLMRASKLQIATAHAWRVARRSEVTIRRNVPHHLNAQQRHAVRKAVINARDEFLDATPLGWWQVIMIFFFCSILGLVLEEIWMLITAGLTESRVGLVWGPFSPLYGVGAVLLTFMAYQLRRHHAKNWHVFFCCRSCWRCPRTRLWLGMEHLLHAQSWSYAHLPDHITDYVAWRFFYSCGDFLALYGLALSCPNSSIALGFSFRTSIRLYCAPCGLLNSRYRDDCCLLRS